VAINGIATCSTNSNFGTLTVSNITTSGTQVNVSCNGISNGTAAVSANGGIGSYSWSPSGGTGAIATGLAPGVYTVTVTDAILCTGTRSFTITQPPALAGTTSTTSVSCFGGSNGTATIVASGGTPGYTYLWSNGATTATATGIAAGTYSVTITDANSCLRTVNNIIVGSPSTLNGIPSTTSVSCFGGSNGTATITASGGTPGYTYLWSNGVTTATTGDLTAGTYLVTVTDANGCSVSEEVVIIEPLAILIDLQPADVSTTTGNNAQFITMAANADNYQWFVSEDGDSWTAINDGGTEPVYSGATTNTLTLENVPASLNGYLYRLQLTNGTDCSTLTDVAILTVTNLIEAVNDDFSTNLILEGTEGIAGDVTGNDLFNNLPVNDSDVLITVIDNGGLAGVAIDSEGNLTVPATGTAGTYIITYQICDITSANNCTTAQAIVVISPVAGTHDSKDIRFTVYPNPASTMVFVKLSDFSANSNLKATLYDLNGRLIRENNVSTETFGIDVSGLESAIYILNITSDTAKATKRIMVDKKP
jgi:hypothetical protein